MGSHGPLGALRGQSFGSLDELEPVQLLALLDLADELKSHPQRFQDRLDGVVSGLVFEKHSTRTRVSFEAGIRQLGGGAIFLSSNDLQLGRGEPIADTARVLGGYLDNIVLRTYAHERFEKMRDFAGIPVVNALTDRFHPCQILADLQTIRAHKPDLASLILTWVGDGNNVAHSVLLGASLCGMEVRLATPDGYTCDAQVMDVGQQIAMRTGGRIIQGSDPDAAVDGADVVITDVFASMGQEAEREKRLRDFSGYCVDEERMERAKADAIFLHCLPAHRGEEVSAGVLEGRWSVVWEEAENRLHAQKALLLAIHGRVDEVG